MKKKGIALLVALLLVLGLVACTDKTTTTTTSGNPDTTTTSATPDTTTTTTTVNTFTVAITGLTDVGFEEEDKILAGEWFDLLTGVSAIGSDSVEYKDQISFSCTDDACQIEEGKLMSTGPKTCVIEYTLVTHGKVVKGYRTIKISAAPVTIEFTATDKWDNETILGTDYVVTTTQGAVNTFFYWIQNDGIIGTTGGVQVLDDELVITQEALGDETWSLQAKMLTDISLENGRTYKLSFTVTSDVDRYIDVVMKAPNDNYANDTHSIVEIKAGTGDYEAVFVAPQEVLYLNLCTGVFEGSGDAGTLEFSNFVLHEGPVVYEYEEVTGFFVNEDIAVGTIAELVTTDSDFVREFYYWSNGGAFTIEYVEGGIEVDITEISTADGSDGWGIQVQFNDMLKEDFTLLKNAMYKVSMNLNSTVARTIAIEITGSSNSLPASTKQVFEIAVGDNLIEFEFESLYDYYFMKILMGNFGDLTPTGTFTITDLKLFVDKNASPSEEVELSGNKFLVSNPNGAVGTEAKQYNFYTWNGEGSAMTATATDGEIAFDIENVGTQFWAIQAKYSGTLLTPFVDYELYFEVYSEVARKIQFEIKDAAFSGVYFSREVQLQPGLNRINYVYFNEVDTFNLQLNIGKFGEADAGELVFKNFVLCVPTTEDVDFVVNGDFAEATAMGLTDAIGWAYWTTKGVDWLADTEEYDGTAVIADGVLTSTTTVDGHEVWASQIQYNHGTATMTVGEVYRVEMDVNSNVATTVPFQLKGATDGANIDIYVDLVAGDNHLVLYYVAPQETFRFFIMPGLTAAGTILVIDNFKVYKPAPSTPLTELINRFGTPVNENTSAIGTADEDRYSFFSWTDAAALWTGSYTDGHALVDITNTGNNFWDIQLKYRGSLLTIGHKYVLTFNVNSEVARKINIEIKDGGFSGKTIGLDLLLVAGDNEISIPFTATFATLNIQFNLGNFAYDGETVEVPVNEVGLLDFSDFYVVSDLIESVDYVDNGDFTDPVTFVAADAAGWAYWTTQGATWLEENPEYIGTAVVSDGVMTVSTTQKGHEKWACQIQYNHATDTLTIGDTIRVELDIHSNVATSIWLELKGATDAENVDISVDLVAGDNHVIVEYTVSQVKFRFFIMPGLTEPGTVLTFDNIKLFVPEVPVV